MLQKMNAFADDSKTTRKVVRDLSSALGTIVTKMADIEVQLADERREKNEILEDMKEIKKRLLDLENDAQPKPTAVNTSTYASVTSSNLPPAPNMTHKPKSTEPNTVKPLKAEYPRAAREIVITFQNAPLCDTSTNAADRALTAVNNAMVLSPVKKYVFFGARFSIMDNLILTTALHSSNEGLDEHLETIEKAVNYIGLATARCDAVWSEFLLHGVPTHLELETIRNQVEGYCSGIKLGQTPRWLAPPEARSNKTHSTIVLAFVGKVNFTQLGGRSIMVGNRSCNLTTYAAFGPQTLCLNCQGFGHPKAFCQTSLKCAVCAQDHETAQHPCDQPQCKKGLRCMHGAIQCINCKQSHKASDRNCPTRMRVSQEFRLQCRARRGWARRNHWTHRHHRPHFPCHACPFPPPLPILPRTPLSLTR
jgi:hypothetical protein